MIIREFESNHPLIYHIGKDQCGYLHISGIGGNMKYLYYTVREAKRKYLNELPTIGSCLLFGYTGIMIKGVDNSGFDDTIYYTMGSETRLRKSKVNYTKKGKAYFNTPVGRMHLSEFIKHY